MNKLLAISWSILSLLVSGLFIFHGLSLFQIEELPMISFLSAFVAVAYGVVNVYLLSLCWTKPGEKLITFIKYIVIAMLIIQIALRLSKGMISGLEWAGLLLVAIMLSTNWFAAKYVKNYKKA